MPSKKPAIKDEADPRFLPVAKAFSRNPAVSLMESKSGGTRSLMLNGKSFGMSMQGHFVLAKEAHRLEASPVIKKSKRS
ncbi:MAG TPA: hypothetical protein VH083_18030 [Myxococcales bacterium]|jgi:hypothetical protein|nr:hypothetical protein [Myxococcales bacterium]